MQYSVIYNVIYNVQWELFQNAPHVQWTVCLSLFVYTKTNELLQAIHCLCYQFLLYGTANPSILIGSFLIGISPYGPFPWKRWYAVYFLFSKAHKFKTSMARVPYNKLLTNRASSSHTGEYWPSVIFVRTSLRSVHTAATSGQYSPVRPSLSVSKRLVFPWKIRKSNSNLEDLIG